MKRIAENIWTALRKTFNKELMAKQNSEKEYRRYSDPSWDSNYILPDRTRRIENEVNLREERSNKTESIYAFNDRSANIQYC